MSRAKSGDTVIVHYTGRLSDGTEFESTKRGEPLEITLGKGSMIAGFERAVVGMKAGQTKTVAVQPEQAYGNHSKDMVQEFMRSDLPEGLSFQLGMKLRASGPQGEELMLTVTDVHGDRVTLDANHPLAGKVLSFEIELVAIASSAFHT